MRVRSLMVASLLSVGLAGLAWAKTPAELQALVNQANGFANRQEYTQAIPLYEEAVKALPNEATLKKNLSVIYFNRAMQLQDEKKYAEAEVLLAKSEALAPGQPEVNKARAGMLFYQSQDLRAAGSLDYAQMRDLLNRAAEMDNSQFAYVQALAATYLDEGYGYAINEQYDLALPLMEKAREIDLSSNPIKQSLANVYLGLAKQAKISGNEADFEQYAVKALATDNNPRLTEIIEQLRNPDLVASNAGQSFTDMKAGQTRGNKLPAEAAKLTLTDMIRDVENGLGIEPNQGSLMERVSRAEQQVYGAEQAGALAIRTKDLYAAVLGEGALVASDPSAVQAPVETSENSYLDEVFKVTDGKVIRWGKFPLRVHIEEPTDNGQYRVEYLEAVRHGLNAWNVKTNGFISFVEVKNPDAADVRIQWGEQYTDRFADPDTVPEFYQSYTPPKRSSMMKVLQMASMFTPGFYSLAPQAMNAALQYREYKKLAPLIEESTIVLGLNPTDGLAEADAELLIQNMAAKEFGHVLGLKGHSTVPGDLMYPELKHDAAQLPTDRDLETLRQLYNRPPNIVLNYH